MAIVY